MSFILEVSKTGKDVILFNKHKYRESYSLKNGDVVWKCLGRNCKAYVTTNSGKTGIFSIKESHSGPHPITMRSLTPKQERNGGSQVTPTPSVTGADSPRTSDTPSSIQNSTPTPTPILDIGCLETPNIQCTTEHTDESLFSRLEAENIDLKEQITKLKEQLKCVMDHTIVNDARLLQYTNDIFSSNTSSYSRTEMKLPVTVDCATQCIMDSHVPDHCDGQILSDDLLVNINKLTTELKNKDKIINLLQLDASELSIKLNKQEEELNSLREKLIHIEYFNPPKCSYNTSQAQCNNFSLKTSNRFMPLDELQPLSPSKDKHNNKITVQAEVHQSDTYTPRHSQTLVTTHNKILPPKKSIVVLADSHGRGLYRYLQCIGEDYDVYVHTKPGAKLKSIVKEGLPLIQNLSKEDYVIIIAGTNDMNDKEPGQLTIREGLNYLLGTNIRTNIIINSIPYRYDSPHLNDRIYFVNSCITSRLRKYKGATNLIYGEINLFLHRKHYTNHGLHLNKKGKHILSGAIIDTIRRRATPVMSPTQGKAIGPDQFKRADTDFTTSPGKTIIQPQYNGPDQPPPLDCLTEYPPLVVNRNIHPRDCLAPQVNTSVDQGNPEWSAIEPFPDENSMNRPTLVNQDVPVMSTVYSTHEELTSLKDIQLNQDESFLTPTSSSSLCFLEKTPNQILNVTV